MAEAKITVHVDASAFAAGLREALDLIDFTALDPRPVRRFPSLHDPAIFSAERHMGSVRVRAAVVLHGATVEIVPWPQAGAYDERSVVWGGQSRRQRRDLERSGTPAAVAIARLDKWAAARVVETPPRVVVRPSRAPGSGHLVGRPVSYGSYVRGCRCSGCVQSRSDYRADLRRRKQERTAS